jgi:hypothetical protein
MVGLGARDSIADMSKLIHRDDDDYDCTDTTKVMIVNDGSNNNNAPHEPGSSSRVGVRRPAPSARRSGGSWTCPSRNESFDSLICFDNDSGVAGTDNESEVIVHEEMVTILNDGIAAQEASTIPQDRPVITPLVLPTVSATNTRSLDSYRSRGNNSTTTTTTNNGSRATKSNNLPPPSNTPTSQTYALFSYEGYNYDDYYSEDSYAIGGGARRSSSFDSYDDSVWGRRQEEEEEEENVFCCLFAPWMGRMRTNKSIENGVLDSTSSSSSSSSSSNIVAQSTKDIVVEGSCPPPHQLSNVDTKSSKSLKEKDNNNNDDEDDGKNIVNPKSKSTTLITSTSSPRSQPSLDEELPSIVALSVQTTTRLDSDMSATSVDIDDNNRTTATAAAIDPQAKMEQGDDKPPPASPPVLPPLKGILKVRRCSTMEVLQKPKPKKDNTTETTTIRPAGSSISSSTGRKLFPTYEPKKTNNNGGGGGSSSSSSNNDRSVDFIPMARVITIPSRRGMPLGQRARIWWQKCDYDEFKKTGRIISKAMECGGSEVWLTSSNAWGNRSATRGGVGGKAVVASSSTTTKTTTTTPPDAYTRALSKYVRNDSDDSLGGEGGGENKWWCKFGHSRRGLEHVVSSSEGKARQSAVQLSTQMVLDEQRRQRLSRMKDPNKLRNVAMQYTSWASNLALASGFADAEAVKFDPTKSTWSGNRANHFAKRMSSNLLSGGMGGASSLVALIIQEVDVKELNVGVNGGPTSRVVTTAVTSQILDANTHKTKTTATTHNSSNNKAKSATTRHTKVASAVGVDEDITSLSSSEEVSLKKRAKGFIPGGGDEATLMMGMRTIVA